MNSKQVKTIALKEHLGKTAYRLQLKKCTTLHAIVGSHAAEPTKEPVKTPASSPLDFSRQALKASAERTKVLQEEVINNLHKIIARVQHQIENGPGNGIPTKEEAGMVRNLQRTLKTLTDLAHPIMPKKRSE